MVPLDESDGSMYALKWALDHLVTRPKDLPQDSGDPDMITAVHVQQPFQPFIYPAGPGSLPIPLFLIFDVIIIVIELIFFLLFLVPVYPAGPGT